MLKAAIAETATMVTSGVMWVISSIALVTPSPSSQPEEKSPDLHVEKLFKLNRFCLFVVVSTCFLLPGPRGLSA